MYINVHNKRQVAIESERHKIKLNADQQLSESSTLGKTGGGGEIRAEYEEWKVMVRLIEEGTPGKGRTYKNSQRLQQASFLQLNLIYQLR